MSFFKSCNMLANYATPYWERTPEDDVLFNAAMAEADSWHKQHNLNYAKLWQGSERPVIPVNLFKTLDLSTPVEGDGMWLTSSGTGKRSATRVFFDQKSLGRIEKGMLGIFMTHEMYSQKQSRFLLLSPDPRKGDFPGYATSFFKYTGVAPVQEIVFVVNEHGKFDAPLALEMLRKWADDDAPIFIFGLTVFFEQLALALTQSISFKGEVKGITGGGWKGLTKTMEREQILKVLNEKFHAPVMDVRDVFGMTEHPLHYLSCQYGHFHEPVYSRFKIMDVNGQEAAKGELGLIRLQNPFYASLPAHDILTQDSGVMGCDCPCQSQRPYLQYHGRVSANEGICAADAVKV